MQPKNSNIFSKIAKLVLWVLVPTLFISGTKLENLPPSEGDYMMQITGNLSDSFSGGVDFETASVTTSKGISFSTLKLKFDNKESIASHSLEFLISRENTSGVLSTGTYEVSRNQEGLLNYFDGVFGFANINVLGESPLFAKSGKIQIDYIDNTTVKGKISIQMTNSIGKSVGVNGNFTVKKQ